MFVICKEIHKFTAKDSQINSYELCLGNISKNWSIDNMKKASLKGYVYNFSVDYDAIVVSDILDIYKYLIKKEWNSIKMFKLIKQIFVSTLMFFGSLLSINP